MLTTALDTRCTSCKIGTLILVGRPGRVVRHDGVDIEVPRDFLIPTCDHCGADRLDAAQLIELAAALSKSRLMALRSAPTQEMKSISDDEDIDDC